MQTLPIEQILVSNRIRSDLGDIADLAQSIARYGLLQPIVLTQDNRLIAGERRLRACISLNRTEIPVVFRETMSDAELHELELEENVRRKAMSWQERCLGIAHIHELRVRDAALASDGWGRRETGELVGMGVADVHYAIVIAERLACGDEEVMQCENFSSAIRLLLRRKEDEANATLIGRQAAPAKNSLLEALLDDEPRGGPVLIQPDIDTDETAPRLVRNAVVPLSNMFVKANALEWMQDHVGLGLINAIITDPPYGIDMAMLQQEGGGQDVARVVKEHGVDENIELLKQFVPLAHAVLSPDSWLVMWCDMMHWRWLHDLAIATGFRVQRWPLIWAKTSPCSNLAASKNFTKTYEIALVAAKGTPTLRRPMTSSIWVGDALEERKRFGHPFAKPIKLWQWIMSGLCTSSSNVLDPFAGVGSCCVAAAQMHLRPLGVEINEKHHAEGTEQLRRTYIDMYGGVENVTIV